MVDFYYITNLIFSTNFHTYVFPFLLLYGLVFTILSSDKITIFRNKDGKLMKKVVIIISFIFASFGSVIEIGEGKNLASFMEVLFPNVTTIGLLILALYLVSSSFGYDFFKGLYRKDTTGYIIIFFVLLVFGISFFIFLDYTNLLNFSDMSSNSMVLFAFFLGTFIVGIVLVLLKIFDFAVGFIIASITFGITFVSGGEFVEAFQNPILIIGIIFTFLFSWLNLQTKEEKIKYHTGILEDTKETLSSIEKDKYKGEKPEDYKDLIYDIVDGVMKRQQENLEKLGEKKEDGKEK